MNYFACQKIKFIIAFNIFIRILNLHCRGEEETLARIDDFNMILSIIVASFLKF